MVHFASQNTLTTEFKKYTNCIKIMIHKAESAPDWLKQSYDTGNYEPKEITYIECGYANQVSDRIPISISVETKIASCSRRKKSMARATHFSFYTSALLQGWWVNKSTIG